MQSDASPDKTFAKSPCKPLEPCAYDDDYDPCGSSDDITDKDLAILLQEEAAKLKKNDDGYETNDEDVDQRDEKKKKKVCKNFIKNPFFTNPFKFSSDLPAPPPAPPPQFFPPTETESTEKVCQKGKKKKVCKKKCELVLDEGGPTGADGLDDDKGVEGDVEDEGEEEEHEEDKKKRCRKRRSEKPTCRKKVSDVSISLLPPTLPPRQRDLPPKSPKDIPEVERQVLMACGGLPEPKCKKRKEKTKTKRNS